MSRFPDISGAGVGAGRALLLAAVAGIMIGAVTMPSEAGKLGLGREATGEEVAGWDIDVRPDGQGLPQGKGTVKEGEELFITNCAACHGEFGEAVDRWPVLAGGHGSLTNERPEKTIGSYWQSLSTVFDYVRRAMPYGNAQSLEPDQIYAITAYLLFLNDVVKDESFELSQDNFASIKLPNGNGFYDDDRDTTERHFWNRAVCMTDCKAIVEVTGRAQILDVTPDNKSAPRVD